MPKPKRARVPDAELVDFAARLRDAMRGAGYDPDKHGEQTRLANDAGVHQSIVSRALSPERFPQPPLVHRLALHLGVAPAWLQWGDLPKRLTAAREPGSGASAEDLMRLALEALHQEKR